MAHRVLVSLLVVVAACAPQAPLPPPPETVPPPPPTTVATTTTTATSTTTTLPEREPGTVPGWTVGRPWGTTTGFTMFRGNPTRTWYGTGPIPSLPRQLWRYPEDPMCGRSTVGGQAKLWCGTGWTGQPVVWERPDGVTEVIFGAYDKAVHFLDASSGQETRPAFAVGDIIKGSVTLDPDGYPLIYFGSRDDRLRVVALDRAVPTELWSLDASAVEGVWNNDWDGNPVVIDDLLFEGGENGWFFAIRLNRTTGENGLVGVTPEVVVQLPGYTNELLAVANRNVSIESSVAVFEEVAYFANSGGRVVGLDISAAGAGKAPMVFDYWVGDDVDATVVADAEGALYVSVELERHNRRSRELGQLIKLDPRLQDDPYVWGVAVPGVDGDGGIWATPALGDGVIYVTTHPGELLAVEASTGEVVWQEEVGWHAWSSPSIVDDTLVVATCEGQLRGYSLEDPLRPDRLFTLQVSESCLESTPAIWDGVIFLGSRDGFFYGLG